MDDIVKSLRKGDTYGDCKHDRCMCVVMEDAANEIERLRKKMEILTACYQEVCSQRDQLMKAFSPPRDTPRPVETW